MKIDNRTKLNECVGFLKKLHFKPENIMVTGSIALDMCGVFPEGRYAHDVDVVIKMDDKSWRCMRLLEEIYGCNKKKGKDYPKTTNSPLVFEVNGVIINIWKDQNYVWSDVVDNVTGIHIAQVKHIIEEKKKYARNKDNMDIHTIIKSFL